MFRLIEDDIEHSSTFAAKQDDYGEMITLTRYNGEILLLLVKYSRSDAADIELLCL